MIVIGVVVACCDQINPTKSPVPPTLRPCDKYSTRARDVEWNKRAGRPTGAVVSA